MRNDKRPNDFAERLRRIEESKKQGQPAIPPQVRKDLTYDNSGGPQDNRLRNGIIWSVIAAGMATGGYFAVQAVPPEMSSSLASLGAVFSSGTTVQSMNGSGDFTTMSEADAGMRGASLQSPAVASSLPDPVTLADLVTGVAQPDDTTQIGQIIPFDRNDQCNLRRPLEGEQVVNIRLERGNLPVPVRAFSDVALVRQLASNVTAVTQDGRAYNWEQQVPAPMTGVDVFLTDKSAPIYLVLQNLDGGIIWNVQTAPGVTLAHVAIVSSGFSGLVSPPETTGVEALLVSDFVPRHAFGADDTVRACMIRPWRDPQPDWEAVQRAPGNPLYSNQVQSFTTGYAAYNAWYMGTLGVDAGTNLVAPETADHVHFGPMPDAPFAYQAMNGRDVHLMRADHMLSGDAITLQAAMDALHGRVLREAIGGDIALLDPAPVERTSP